jgi:hypothetical protein
MSGFIWAYNEGGGAPLIQTFVVKASAVLTEFCLVNFESGEADLAATNDSALLGATVEAVDNTVDGHSVRVVINTDAVFAVADANARTVGDTLDIGTGALTVAATSNADLVVVRTSAATEPTYVKFTAGNRWSGTGLS